MPPNLRRLAEEFFNCYITSDKVFCTSSFSIQNSMFIITLFLLRQLAEDGGIKKGLPYGNPLYIFFKQKQDCLTITR